MKKTLHDPMAKKQTADNKTGGSKYECLLNVSPNAKMLCGRTGIRKLYKDLTDEDIEKMIAAGNTDFKKK